MCAFRNPAAMRVVADAVDVAAVAIGAGDVGAVGRCWLLWAECLVPIDVLSLMLVSLPFPCSCHATSCEASLCIESMV